MADYVDKGLKRIGITIPKPTLAIVCILSGLMVIMFPALLVWIVGLFLVIQGAFLLTDHEQKRRITTTTASKSVYCHNCGAGNTEEAVYCERCGKELMQIGQIVTTQAQEATQ